MISQLTMKLIFLLTRVGIIQSMTKELYSTLWDIYLKSANKLTKEDINQFETIIHDLKFKKNCKIRLMGDEFAERGSNDIFTMLFFKKMNNNNVPKLKLLSYTIDEKTNTISIYSHASEYSRLLRRNLPRHQYFRTENYN